MGFVALYPLVTLRHPHVSTPHTSRNEFTYGEAEWKRIPLGRRLLLFLGQFGLRFLCTVLYGIMGHSPSYAACSGCRRISFALPSPVPVPYSYLLMLA